MTNQCSTIVAVKDRINRASCLMPQYNADAEGLEITGDVTINGEVMSKSFFLENAAYVPQEDRLWSALTGNHNPLSCSL